MLSVKSSSSGKRPGEDCMKRNHVELHKTVVEEIQSGYTCGHHPYRCSTVTVCYTLITLVCLLDDLIFEDELSLSRLGVRHRYEIFLKDELHPTA